MDRYNGHSSKSQNIDLAYSFINNILDVPVAQQITEQLLYSSPNGGLESLLADGKLKASHLREVTGKQLEFLKDLGARGEIWDQLWTEAKSH